MTPTVTLPPTPAHAAQPVPDTGTESRFTSISILLEAGGAFAGAGFLGAIFFGLTGAVVASLGALLLSLLLAIRNK